MSVLERPQADSPALFGIKALDTAAIVADLDDNTVMRQGSIRCAVNAQNIARAVRCRQIEITGIRPERSITDRIVPGNALCIIVQKVLRFAVIGRNVDIFRAHKASSVGAARAIELDFPIRFTWHTAAFRIV